VDSTKIAAGQSIAELGQQCGVSRRSRTRRWIARRSRRAPSTRVGLATDSVTYLRILNGSWTAVKSQPAPSTVLDWLRRLYGSRTSCELGGQQQDRGCIDRRDAAGAWRDRDSSLADGSVTFASSREARDSTKIAAGSINSTNLAAMRWSSRHHEPRRWIARRSLRVDRYDASGDRRGELHQDLNGSVDSTKIAARRSTRRGWRLALSGPRAWPTAL